MIEAGITSPHSEKTLPDSERINGAHIASYANMLKSNLEEYQSRFSGLLSLGLNPEDYPSHITEVKGEILNHDPKKHRSNKITTKTQVEYNGGNLVNWVLVNLLRQHVIKNNIPYGSPVHNLGVMVAEGKNQWIKFMKMGCIFRNSKL